MPAFVKIVFAAVFGWSLCCSAMADSPQGAAPSESAAAPAASDGLALWRQIAGWTALGILVVWFATRGLKKGENDGRDGDVPDEQTGEDK